jgi:flagellin
LVNRRLQRKSSKIIWLYEAWPQFFLARLLQFGSERLAEGLAYVQKGEGDPEMLSVNTNTSAMVALQYLNKTENDLQETQTHINTGLKVATAKDDGATFAIAQNMRGNVAGYRSVADSLNRGVSTVDVAISAGGSISDLLIEMKAKVLAAADTSLDTASRAALNADFVALRDQIQTIVENASFNGTNLVDGSVAMISALASADGTKKITVQGQQLSLSGTIVMITSTAAISTQATASAMVNTINASIQNVNAALAALASGQNKFSIQKSFVEKLMDTLNGGIGNLVDADMAVESARLQALQVKQQLGVQALSIANAQPQIILSLFRGS